MCDELGDLLEGFDGQLGRIRCFAHILNLAAKAILRQFEVPKAKAGAVLSDAEQALADLMKDVDLEDDWTSGLDTDEDKGVDDNTDGLLSCCTYAGILIIRKNSRVWKPSFHCQS